MKSLFPWIVAAIAAQSSMILYLENTSLRRENRICHSAGNLLRDQVAELNSCISRMTSERDHVATKNYVLGATQAINDPQKFGDLWHDGYNKGINQTQYVSEHESE